MKIIAVGDIHGRTIWQDIAEKEQDFNQFIFMGDYFDPIEDIAMDEVILNFSRIIKFKQQHGNKVTLLFGNHDFHYLKSIKEFYNRYNFDYSIIIEDLIDSSMQQRYFSLCYRHQHFLFSHAGITKTWLNNHNIVDNDGL